MSAPEAPRAEGNGGTRTARAGGEDGEVRRLVGVVGAAERGGGETVVGHFEQDARGCRDAGEGAGEHADEGADVDERAKDRRAGEGGEDAEGSVGLPGCAQWSSRNPRVSV